MYNEYFHFSELPFSIAPDPHFIFMSTRHQEGLAHLLYGINYGGGFVALTGEVGTGKTTLCHCLLQQLPDKIDVALILNPMLDAVELIATICDELGIAYDKNRETLKNLIDALNRHLLEAHANGRRTVLIVDEAQNLSLEVLEQIRLLTNLETDKTKLLQIILVGQPELNGLLNRHALRQLNQRITARYHLTALSLEETRAYIRHRLTRSKGDPDLFNENAIKEVFKLSAGVPRLINIICHCALLGAYSIETRVITSAMIRRAARETMGYDSRQTAGLKLLAVLVVLASLAGWLYSQGFMMARQKITEMKPLLSNVFPNLVFETPLQPTKVIPTQAKPISAKQQSQPFITWINNPEFTLSEGIRNALERWGRGDKIDDRLDCAKARAAGLVCHFDKGNWKDLMNINRPTVMEFSLSPEIKRYALLTGVHDGQAVLHFKQDRVFPLADVLAAWDGYYLLLWKPSKPGLKVLQEGQTSADVDWLRERLSVLDGHKPKAVKPRFFDAELKARVIDFQKSKQLMPDGKAGAQTLFHLDNATGALDWPHLKD